MKKSKKILALIFAIIILIYIIYAIYLLVANPTDTYIIKQGTISEENETTGYIIRDETVVKSEEYENGIYPIVAEGEKVSKADPIFRYYSDDEKDITAKINEIDYKIQELLEKEKLITTADIKAIENQIEEKVEKARILTNTQEITEYKTDIDNLITKKIKFIGDITENNEIKQLIKERKNYENQLKNGTKYINAEKSGIVSYRIDGLENELKVDNFENITSEKLENIGIRTGQIIATSNESGKIIDNFKCYIAVIMSTDIPKATEAKLNDKVVLRILDEEINAKIVKINDESGKRVIIFEINKMTDDLINHRKISVDVVWWSKTGLKVPNQALIEENGLYYVMRNKAGKQVKLLVKLKGQTDKFSIITSYSLKELQEIGYSEDEIKNYKKINNYDEILLNSQ